MTTGFPENLRRVRQECLLSQAELGQLLKVTRQAVWSWEQGRTEPPLAQVAEIAAVLGVSLEELIPTRAG